MANEERDAIILDVVKSYERHPQVLSESERYNTRPTLKKSPTDLLSRYFEEAGQYALLTAEDEVQLFGDIEDGIHAYKGIADFNNIDSQEEQTLLNLATAYQILYKSNTKLVISIAEKYKNYNILPFLDLIQEGNVGLSKAILRFDVAKGYKFSTYATIWIEQNITRSLGNDGRLIRLPVNAHEKWVKLTRVALQLSQQLDREATAGEIAEVMGMSAKQVEDLRKHGAINLKSLNEPVGDAEQHEFGDIVVDPNKIENAIDNLSDRQYLLDILVTASLEPRELAVLCLRHGVYFEVFDDLQIQARDGQRSYKELMRNMPTEDGITLETTGELFGITRERIRQIEAKAFEKVRISLELEEEAKAAAEAE